MILVLYRYFILRNNLVRRIYFNIFPLSTTA
uniref:Uncharacterized protein n=1 Tax=Siphoviridae sp. ctxc31 TaxID=2826520 RepID=A0A8S5MMS9_9CAUD|nr:MAG TPA: hypothetical protein [Siphoviridae sp. ctxc31]